MTPSTERELTSTAGALWPCTCQTQPEREGAEALDEGGLGVSDAS